MAERRIHAACFPPAEYIRDFIDQRGWSRDDLLRHMNLKEHIIRKHIDAVLDDGAPVSDWFALGLSRAFGTSWELWRNLERAWQSWVAERNKDD